MKRFVLAATATALCFICGISFALDVDVNEIRSDEVKFENYVGVGVRADSTEDILSIGRQLSQRAKRLGAGGRRVRYGGKYSVVRIISNAEPEKYSADIMYIDREAKVTHILNLRKIISGYLSDMYGYSNQQANALAVFITYYNALHRQDLDFFASKYKSAAVKMATKNNAGLALKYSEWPGNTAMFIPLTSEKIDPFAIGDKETIEAVSKEKKTMDDRKAVTDLKKESVAEKKEALQKERDEQKKKEAELQKQKEEAAEKKRTAVTEEEKKQAAEAEKKAAEKEKQLEEEKAKSDEKEKDIKDKEKEIREEEQQQAADKLKEDLEKNPEEAEKTLDEKAKELEEREKELNKQEDRLREGSADKNVFGNRLYYLKIKDYLDEGHYNNELVMIDPAEKKVVFTSPIKTICGRKYDIFSKGIAVITHKGNHNSEHRLTLIDRASLEEVASGEDNIFWRSFVEIRDGFIYAIIVQEEGYYLAKFDENLQKVAVSEEKVNENTFISFYEDMIYINREDRQIMVLNKEDLTMTDVIEP